MLNPVYGFLLTIILLNIKILFTRLCGFHRFIFSFMFLEHLVIILYSSAVHSQVDVIGSMFIFFVCLIFAVLSVGGSPSLLVSKLVTTHAIQ
jgi:hypothetical protein